MKMKYDYRYYWYFRTLMSFFKTHRSWLVTAAFQSCAITSSQEPSRFIMKHQWNIQSSPTHKMPDSWVIICRTWKQVCCSSPGREKGFITTHPHCHGLCQIFMTTITDCLWRKQTHFKRFHWGVKRWFDLRGRIRGTFRLPLHVGYLILKIKS